MNSSQYLVGIDLGTTHTVVAYANQQDPARSILLFPIPQQIAPGEVADRPLLPSVRYHPAIGELGDHVLCLAAEDSAVLGEAARHLGAKSLGRLVTSAKSWLSHTDIDPTAAILPWGSDESVFKVSPLAACASYLAQVRSAWDQRFPEALLSEQSVVITVPASFDESARALTLEAARLAGIGQVRLLEEPQAVCYDWLRRHQDDLAQRLSDRRLMLVCDVGGGTTDFTLIRIDHGQSKPTLQRIAVGDHLLLGGDNIDLALAHLAESRLRLGDKKLSAAEFAQLIEQSRIAKELLLSANAPEFAAITLLGSGSQLIGGTRSTQLSREEVRQMALEGFLPLSGLQDLPDRKRSAVVEFGLPYASDPAISKHIAAFLQQHWQTAKTALQAEHGVPDTLLLNGGVFRSDLLVQRLQQVLAQWSEHAPPLVLDNPHPELAVAYGAVAYAQARLSNRGKIAGGAARSYFLRVDRDDSQHKHGICILPKASEEGQEIILNDRQFALRVGQPVQFHLLSNSGDTLYQPGEMVLLDDQQFHSLPPLAIALQGQQKQEIKVRLSATYSELGTLQLQCIAVENPEQRWDLEFQVRHQKPSVISDVALPAQLPQAIQAIQQVFGAKSRQIDPQAVKTLRADLEKILQLPRAEWTTPVLRELFNALLEGAKYRRRTEAHERLWLSLTGFCLRPGFGYPLDEWRIEQLWKLYPEGLQFISDKQNWAEWWTLWRRVAGGLTAEAQSRIFGDIDKFIDPAAARQPGVSKQLAVRSYEDMVRLVAVLEHLPVTDKTQLGEWLLKRLQKAGEPEQSWWALGRIGARELFHGHHHDVIGPAVVGIWLQQLLLIDWKKQPQAAFAATLLARRCDDRARDIDDDLRLQVINKLKQAKAPASWLDMVESFRQLDAQQEKQMFGEALPPGLKILD